MKQFADFVAKISQHGSRVALLDDASGETLTYTQLTSQAMRVAAQLARLKVRPGDRIVLYKIRDIDWVPCFLGAQLAHVVVVPLDTRLSTQTVKAMIATTKPKFIITEENFPAASKTLAPAELLGPQNTPTTPPKTRKQTVISEILLTSGTWSQPKGVTLTQANLLHNLLATYRRYPLQKDETFLSILPLSHAYEQMCGLLMPLYAGAKIVYIQEVTPETLKNAFRKYQVTMVVAVPRVLQLLQKGILRKLPPRKHLMFLRLTRAARYMPRPLRRSLFKKVHQELAPHLHTLVIGGAPYERSLDTFFQGLGYQTLLGYGLSETAPIISICTQPRRRTPGSVGRPIENLGVKINKKGEILVKGPTVFHGYWPNQHTATWFNTEDQGFLNRKGDLVLTGRTKNLIIYPNGDKLYLEDVERIADSLQGVEESCVLYSPAVFDGVFDMVVKAGSAFDEAVAKAQILARLPSTVRIGRIINTDESLPRTHTLKLQRNKIYQDFKPKSVKASASLRQH